jgi:uncharacterized protein (DUF885 family)
MRRVSVVLLLLLGGCASTGGPGELKSIADDVWARRLEDDLSVRLKLGLPVERMPDPSYEKAAADAAYAEKTLQRLQAINPARLTPEDRITLGILTWQQRLAIDALPHFYLRSQVTPYASAIRTTNQALRESKSVDARLLADYARYIDALTAVVREQQRRGILIAQPEIPAVRALLSNPPAVADAAVRAAHDRFLAVLSPAYEAAAPRTVGISQYPGGREAYRYFIRTATSLDLEPEEIHALGLREIERIERELEAIRNEVNFQGSRDAFLQFLKADARFFEPSADAIRARLERHVRTVEPHIDRFFAKKPRAPYGVQRLDPALEGAMTFGYYKWPTPGDPIGLYYFNGSKTAERNLLFGLALMAHELVPGHHFQVTRQGENESLHPMRRETFDTAFIEGWGEYAAALGVEMGIYSDPYDRAGRLMMDSMLSARLVVDTGMNALGWSRERAMEYLKNHSMLSDTEVATETLRYATDIPGQALAYKIGSLRMLALRKRAAEQLGDRFDIRQFHEWMIGQGSMPILVLEKYVEEKMGEP